MNILIENVDIGRKLVRESVVVTKNVRESAEGFENNERTLFFKENIFKGENSWVGIVHRLRKRKYGKPVSESGLDNTVLVRRDSIIGVEKDLERRGSRIATAVSISFELYDLLGSNLIFTELLNLNQTDRTRNQVVVRNRGEVRNDESVFVRNGGGNDVANSGFSTTRGTLKGKNFL